MKEIWKPIKSFEGLYEISNLGRVKSLKRIVKRNKNHDMFVSEKIIKNMIANTGYYYVTLSLNNKKTHLRIHRLVSEHFLYKVPNKDFINHIDGNKLNNKVTNLEWCTISENNKHAYDIGLKKINPEHIKKLSYINKHRIRTNEEKEKMRETKIKKGFYKKVKNLDTNFIYYTITDAAESLDMNKSTLRKMLTGELKNKTPLVLIN